MTALDFLYKTAPGRVCLKALTWPALSRAAGAFLDTRASKVLINPFVRGNNIDLTEYEADNFTCFNDCFSRRIKPGRREVCMDKTALISPCDGLLSVYEIHGGILLPVKSSYYTVTELLAGDPAAGEFEGGLCLIYRLCVDNYHRYCYVDSGVKGENIHIPGVLHTVRPVALGERPVFIQNSREYTLIDTESFGRLVQMEVGAMLVGRIENYHGPGRVTRGQEKGMFLYGGSTVVVLLRARAARIDPQYMTPGEKSVKYGQRVGAAL